VQAAQPERHQVQHQVAMATIQFFHLSHLPAVVAVAAAMSAAQPHS